MCVGVGGRSVWRLKWTELNVKSLVAYLLKSYKFYSMYLIIGLKLGVSSIQAGGKGWPYSRLIARCIMVH